MTKHHLLWCLGVVAILIGVSRTAWADERPAPQKVVTIEGITEYRLRQRPARAAVPGPIASDRHGEHDRAGRVAA